MVEALMCTKGNHSKPHSIAYEVNSLFIRPCWTAFVGCF